MNQLRPFEATGRLGSVVQAAAELGRTHSAVSRQISSLEHWIGLKLFHRDNGRLTLTETGARYHRAVSDAFDVIHQATHEAMHRPAENVVTVYCPSIFASRWLIPRLKRLRQTHPKIEIWLEDLSKDFERATAPGCIAIFLDAADWREMDVTALMPEFLFPVCGAGGGVRLRHSMSLAGHSLLRSNDSLAAWDAWLGDAGLPEEVQQGPHMADPENAIQAAINGYGTALARGQLVLEDLATGRLFRPLRKVVRIENAYWLVRPKYGHVNWAMRSFVSWMREEASASSKRLLDYLAQDVGLDVAPVQGPKAGHRPEIAETSALATMDEAESILR